MLAPTHRLDGDSARSRNSLTSSLFISRLFALLIKSPRTSERDAIHAREQPLRYEHPIPDRPWLGASYNAGPIMPGPAGTPTSSPLLSMLVVVSRARASALVLGVEVRSNGLQRGTLALACANQPIWRQRTSSTQKQFDKQFVCSLLN